MLPPPVAAAQAPVKVPSGDPDGAGRWRGGPAADGTAPVGPAVGTVEPVGATALALGGCGAWPLPADATCAAVARETFAEAAGVLGLPGELTFDGVTMASELAANTRHANGNVEYAEAGSRPLAGAPELWIYLRRAAGRWELACKVFDSMSGWKDARAPSPGDAAVDAVSGRGLQVVAGLSAGRWGHHLTRSRFGGWKVPGKAVWFGQAVPGTCVPRPLRQGRLAPGRAARALEEMLAERGLGGGLLRVQEPSSPISVLSVRCGLTVWCCDTKIWWRAPDGRDERRAPADLVDIAEQLVCLCAEMDAGVDFWHRGLDRVR